MMNEMSRIAGPAVVSMHQSSARSLASSFSTTAVAATNAQEPNRLTLYFGQMKEICPDSIQAYSRCVINGNESGNLLQGSCDKEFAAIKKCFVRVRRL